MIDGLQIKRLNPEVARKLEARFHNDEIKAALHSIDPRKSPGPDGFIGFYVRTFWEAMKEDILNYHEKFFDQGILPAGINSSFIPLILKVNNPMQVQDYSLISLINCT